MIDDTASTFMHINNEQFEPEMQDFLTFTHGTLKTDACVCVGFCTFGALEISFLSLLTDC